MNWTDVTVVGSIYKCEADLTQRPVKYRHKRMYPDGSEDAEWTPGISPDMEGWLGDADPELTK